MKKKLLALLLAVVMVVALVPTTVVSVFATEQTGGSTGVPQTQTGGGSDTAPEVIVYPEVDVADAVAELVNAAGEHLAYFSALDATALTYVRNGDTVKLLADLIADTTLVVSTPGIKWTLDGAKADGTAAVYNYNGTGYALQIAGEGQSVTVKNLDIRSAKAGIQAGNDDTASELVLENVQVRADGTAKDNLTGNNAKGTSRALYVAGADTCVRVYGDNTVMQAVSAVTVYNEGILSIYGGYYYIHGEGSVGTSAENAVIFTNGASASATIFGGTFVGGSLAKSVIATTMGGTCTVVDGLFIYDGSTAPKTRSGRVQRLYANMFFIAVSGSGNLNIAGGKFYSVRQDAAFVCGEAGIGVPNVVIYDGEFYSNITIGEDQTANDVGLVNTVAQIADAYLRTVTVLAVSEGAFEGAALGVPAGEAAAAWVIVCSLKEEISYNTEHELLVGARPAISVTNPGQEEKEFYTFELNRAFCVLDNGGKVVLLKDVEVDAAINTGLRPANFSWTLTSKAGRSYTLTGNVAGAALLTCSGQLTLENISIRNTAGGLFSVSAGATLLVKGGVDLSIDIPDNSASYNIFTLTDATLTVEKDSYIYINTADSAATGVYFVKMSGASTFNLEKGAKLGYDQLGNCNAHSSTMVYTNGAGSVLNISGELPGQNNNTIHMEKGTLNVYDGAKISAQSADRTVQTPSSARNVTINVYGGALYQPNKDSAIIIRLEKISNTEKGTNNKLNVYGGFFYGSSVGGRMIWLNDGDILIEGGTFLGVNHQILLAEYHAGSITIREGVDENGNKTVPAFYGAFTWNIMDIRQNTKVNISGGYFEANSNNSSYLGIIRCYAAELTITGGTFINKKGNAFEVLAQVEDMNTDDRAKFVTVNDINILGGTYYYTNRFIDVRTNVVKNGERRHILISDIDAHCSGNAGYLLYMKHPDSGGPCEVDVTFRRVNASNFGAQGTWLTSANGTITFEDCNITAMTSDFIYLTNNAKNLNIVFNGGTYRAAGSIVNGLCTSNMDAGGNKATVTINGGTFLPYGNTSAPRISMTSGVCVINDGYFFADRNTAIQAGVGAVDNDLGVLGSIGGAEVYINGGYFVLGDSKYAQETDAIVKAGNSATLGKVYINGGIFVNNSSKSAQTVAKQNSRSTLVVNNATFLSGVEQDNHVLSVGDTNISVDTDTNPTVKNGSGEIEYYAYAQGMPTLAPIGADIMLMLVAGGDMSVWGHGAIYENMLVEQMGDVLTFGTLIATESDVLAAGSLTVEALEATGAEYALIDDTNPLYMMQYEEGLYVGAVALPMSVADYDTKYCFVGYAKLTVGDMDFYIYNIPVVTEGISVRGYAQACLDDVQDVADEYYQYTSIVDTTKYSPYTAEEQAAFQATVNAQVGEPV